MKRIDFLRKSALGLIGSAAGASALGAAIAKNELRLSEQVGFNHLPNKELKTMKTVFHPAQTRGHADHGWLKSHHSFSFANYYNPERMNFGVLRVLNDDRVAPGRGFGKHPHDNMEIVSIPLEGDLEHQDSMGNTAVIRQGDIQVMSAGTGIAHSEYNRNKDQEVKFLQIWVIPNKRGVEPRYDQISLKDQESSHALQQVLSPDPKDAGVWIHQNAWFHLANLKKGQSVDYEVKDPSHNGVYTFVLEGAAQINDQKLGTRDGYGVWETDALTFQADGPARLLIMEVPMTL